MPIRVNTNLKETVAYVPTSERGNDNPVRFHMRRISREKLAGIKDNMVVLDKKGKFQGIRNDTTTYKTVLHMFVGWDGVLDTDGKPIEFEGKTLSDRARMYDMLPREIQEEIESRFGKGSLDWEKAEEEIAKAEAELAAEEAGYEEEGSQEEETLEEDLSDEPLED